MTTIYYNFPEITLSLHGIDSPSSHEIQLSSVGQPLTNMQINNVNYSAKSIIIASSPSATTNPGHLIVKCYADINDTNSNMVFIAIPLTVSTPGGSNPSSSDVDNIINSKGEPVKLTLNNYIKQGGQCVLPPPNKFPLTITLGSDSAIPIQQPINITFYNVGNVSDIKIDPEPGNKANAVLQKQELDWVMTCELLTEDGPTEKVQNDPGTTATTISLFLMTIMIASTAYAAGPILYTELGMFSFAKNGLKDNHYALNVYWGVNLIVLALLCIIKGLKSKSPSYYFIAIALVFSFFSATSGILKLKAVGNIDGTEFANKEGGALAFYKEVISSECYSTFGKIMKGLMVVIFLYAFSMTAASIELGDTKIFISHLILFLIIALLLINTLSYFRKAP
jgi:hypothetical protein